MRKPFQGLGNILRFNWHFYLLAGVALLALCLLAGWFGGPLRFALWASAALAFGVMAVSLAVSWYVYDYSDLYALPWLDREPAEAHMQLLNVHAGFDETSVLLRTRYPDAHLSICDFYDPARHTEISIRRARKAFPPDSATISVSTTRLPFPDGSFDRAFVLFAAHEIRDDAERTRFFAELARVTRPDGRVYLMEHLRDTANFMAYTIGFFHFLPLKRWIRTFQGAGFRVLERRQANPFVTLFILEYDGNAS